ncbi:outer membrane beta-barrel protein [Nonlabens antarcticus]|uniref:outer membrane beta-barrel protein n=1 Tax=Nonlabens antarcticus TaxID=392714 RepID=UPI0018911730|nr:outer membrane beta-barrel protein [Nonlabens antarcticus]
MKSLFNKVLLIIILINTNILIAQDQSIDAKKFDYGIHVGVNSANVTEFSSGDARIGLSAGLYGKYNFSDSGFSVRTGANYSEQGVKNLDETIEGDVINLKYSGDRDWNVIQIPLIFQYTYEKKIGIFLGPQLSFLTEKEESTQNPIFSGVVGVEAFFTQHVFARLQYDNSFTKAFTGLNQRNFPGGAGRGTITTEAKQYVFNLSVGYQF